jgi:hypothetical protein
MLALAKPDSLTSNPNIPHPQLHQKKHTILSGRNMLAESEPTFESAESVSDKETFRFLRRLDRVGMVRSSSPRKRTPERCVR